VNTQVQTRSSHSNQLNQYDQPKQLENSRPARRVSFFDRLALHVGLALITWGRRPVNLESRERRANRIEQAIAREHRLREDERNARLLLLFR
jgi:hypothetical protein